jgi:hypothetical protein
MANPTASDVHVNRPLTNVMQSWALRPRYAFNRVFPIVPVPKQADAYFVWNREDIHRDEAKEMGPGARAPVTVARLSTDSYQCRVYGLAEQIADQVRANADAPLNLDLSATRRVADKIMLKMEKAWISSFFTTGVWTGATTGTDLVGGVDFTKFASPSTGTPVSVIRAQVFHLSKLGIDPMRMKLTLGPDVYRVFLDHQDFLDRYEMVQPGILNEQLMAAVLGVGEVVVPMGVENPLAEGVAQTGNQNAFVASDNMLLSFAPEAASIDEASAGYTFAWSGLVGAANGGMRILRMRDDFHHADHIEGQAALDCKATAPELGVFFSDCI